MDRSDVLTLIRMDYKEDAMAQQIPIEAKRDVFCNIGSVTLNEWSQGGQLGLKPELRAVVFAPDYEGEEIAEYNGARYSVYRTYTGKDDSMELYLERRVGA